MGGKGRMHGIEKITKKGGGWGDLEYIWSGDQRNSRRGVRWVAGRGEDASSSCNLALRHNHSGE